MLETFRLSAFLRKDKLQLVARPDDKFGTGLGADTNPVYACRKRQRSVGLYPYLKTVVMKSGNKGLVYLERRLSTCTYHKGEKRMGAGAGEHICYGRGEVFGAFKYAATGTVGALKVSIAEFAGKVAP